MQDSSIERFLDSRGRVAIWPSKGASRSLVLAYLAQDFAVGRIYREDEVNVHLSNRHTWNDPAFLRRMLYVEGFLHRTPDGSQYWRE